MILDVSTEQWLAIPPVQRTTDDTDPAFVISYTGTESTATYDCGVAVANKITMVIGSTTTTLDLTTASYNTLGEVKAALEAADDGVHVSLVAGAHGWTVYDAADTGNELKLLTVTATSMLTTNRKLGVTQYWDTSECFFRAAAVGIPEDTTLPAQARVQHADTPINRDGLDDVNQYFALVNAKSRLLTANAIATFSSGTAVWEAWRVSDTESSRIFLRTGAATATRSELSATQLSDHGISCKYGEHLVVRYFVDDNVITSSDIFVNGQIAY